MQFPTSFPAGSKAQLRINFRAALTGDMMGYYYSSWKNEGKTKYYALTQFEVCFCTAHHSYSPLKSLLSQATAARRSFPCWDEPLLKATYAISLISRKDTVNLSNMPAKSEESYKGGMFFETFSLINYAYILEFRHHCPCW